MADREYWVTYRPDGTTFASSGLPGDFALNRPPEGFYAFQTDEAGAAAGAVDLDTIKLQYQNKIDQMAGTFRAQFATDVFGQAATYDYKEAEARAWTTGADTTEPDRFIFIRTEAEIRGVAVSQVVAEIIEQVDEKKPLAATIEGHRVHLKEIIRAATTPVESCPSG